jgi:hypothetical protein
MGVAFPVCGHSWQQQKPAMSEFRRPMAEDAPGHKAIYQSASLTARFGAPELPWN